MSINPIYRTILAAQQLGIRPLLYNALYRMLTISGAWKIWTPSRPNETPLQVQFNEAIPFPLPPHLFLDSFLTASDKTSTISEADEIVSGKVRLFGGPPTQMNLNPGTGRTHWSKFEKNQFRGEDIKFTWEPARFGWAIKLARAYLLTHNELYSESFWRFFETFIQNNPTNCGPNWSSGQEVAIRILVFSAVYPVFKDSPYSTTTRKHILARTMAHHAERIPPTLLYAQSQSNNHLLLEAAGLYTASAFIPEHPHAPQWKKLGWENFIQGIMKQVEPDGTYTQHSTNYHRLMLQTALWMVGLSSKIGETLPPAIFARLASATLWLADIYDPSTGQVPNLGNNDGAYILPLTGVEFKDYRPVLQAASVAFLHKPLFPTGIYDEMVHWMGFSYEKGTTGEISGTPTSALRVGTPHCWATLRASRFKFRPAHADQLHVDLWAYGENILRDAGTYQYNGDPPWDNPLSQTAVHNTVEIAGQDQMLRAGRFLWLDPAQAKVLLVKPDEVVAEHDGYKRQGWIHRRSLKYASPDTFIITDRIIPSGGNNNPTKISLQWLLPDWPGNLTDSSLEMRAPFGKLTFSILPQTTNSALVLDSVQLSRSGEILSGTHPSLPYQGWYSPTYGVKIPAVSFRLFFKINGDTTILSKLFIHQTLT